MREDHFAWRNDHPTSDLRDKTILLVGYGRIGRRVAHLCRAFDMRVEVYDPYLPQESAESITLAPDLFEALGRPTRYRCTFPIHRKPDTLWAGEPLPP